MGLLPDTNTSIRENQSGPKKSPEKVRQQRKEYLDELTQEQKKGLLKYFRVDFEMFGYDMRDLES